MEKTPNITNAKLYLKECVLGGAFETELARIEAVDGLGAQSLPRPAVVYVGDKVQPEVFPCLEMVGALATPLNDDDQSSADYLVQTTLVWTLTGSDEEIIQQQVERYIIATRRMIRKLRTGVPFLSTGPIRLGREDASPVTTRHGSQDSPYIRSGAIEVIFQTIDD